jgi:hypothetical protein
MVLVTPPRTKKYSDFPEVSLPAPAAPVIATAAAEQQDQHNDQDD